MTVTLTSDQIRFGQAMLETLNPETIGQGYQKLQQMEDQGIPDAGIALGQYYFTQDRGKAREHYKTAAEVGLGAGWWGLARTMDHSYIPQLSAADNAKWEETCRTAAQLACPEAQRELAESYREKGHVVPAVYWYQKAKFYGDPDADFQMDLAIRMWQEDGSPEDDLSSETEFTEVQRSCGKMLIRIRRGFQDHDTLYALTQDALKEDPVAELAIADLHEQRKNMAGACKIYTLAASHGEAHAMKRLGDLYMAGEGVWQDIEHSVSMYRAAAKKGDREAMYELGKYCEQFERDPEKMAYWYASAYIRGHRTAIEDLRKLVYNNKKTDQQ